MNSGGEMARRASPGRIMELSKDLSLRVGERGDEGRPAGLATGAAAIIIRLDGGG